MFVSTGQGLIGNNMFAYCNNNPVNASDPTGYIAVWDVLDVVSAGASWAEFGADPSLGGFGLALLDTVCLLPLIPSVGTIRRGVGLFDNIADVSKAVDAGVDTAQAVKKGWSVGDDITSLTKAGNNPTWNTVKSRYWKNEALFNPGKYSKSNLELMRKGKAPLVKYAENGLYYPMELHHIKPRHQGGTNALENLLPVTPWEHANIDKYRYFNP